MAKTRPKGKSKGKKTAVATIQDAINGALGKPILRRGSDPYFQIHRIPSGSLTIDRVTGGGYALGRHIELFGNESGGKSLLLYMALALCQQRGKIAALVDPEHSFEPDWFAQCGGDPDELLLDQPESAEDVIKLLMLLPQKQEEGLEIVGIDSVATLIPLEELRNDPTEEDRIAPQARMMSRALRRITPFMHATTFIWTNQQRTNIGGFTFDKNTTPGGRALKFYDTTRLELVKAERVKEKKKVAKKYKMVETEVPYGHWVQVKSVKEKSSRPYGEGSFIFNTDRGEIDLSSEILQLGLTDGMIERTGNTFVYVDLEDNEWSGSAKQWRRFVADEDELREELITNIQENTVQLAKPEGERENGA